MTCFSSLAKRCFWHCGWRCHCLWWCKCRCAEGHQRLGPGAHCERDDSLDRQAVHRKHGLHLHVSTSSGCWRVRRRSYEQWTSGHVTSWCTKATATATGYQGSGMLSLAGVCNWKCLCYQICLCRQVLLRKGYIPLCLWALSSVHHVAWVQSAFFLFIRLSEHLCSSFS